jgi:hypothetical protein
MSYAIAVPDHLLALMEELSWRTRATLHLMLARIAEVAEFWPLDDWRWKQFAYPDELGLRIYVHDCCVRLCLEPETRRVVVREIGRIRVQLPSEFLEPETDSEDAPAPAPH